MDEPTENKNYSFEQSVSDLLQQTPPAMRAFLSTNKKTEAIEKIKASFGLTGVAATIFARDFLLMCLGAIEPNELREALIGTGIDVATANSILETIHKDVFIPLQESEQAQNPSTPTTQEPIASRTQSAPNTTPLVKEYVADPYREPVE